jgi:hypothetical protein
MSQTQQMKIEGLVDPATNHAVVSIALIDGDTALISYVAAEEIDSLIAVLKSARTNAAMQAAEIADLNAEQDPAALNGCGCEDGACALPHGEPS